MNPLPAELLARACRIFLTLAYPDGADSIPPSKRPYLRITADQGLELLLTLPICALLPATEGRGPGYAFRLGRAGYPHFKMRLIDCDGRGTWVASVDTHDTMDLTAGHADAAWLAQLQADNRRLKAQIEPAWEAEGLLTFNGLLRRELSRM